MLPSELPDIGDRACTLDTETSGLHADDGATVAAVAVAWLDDQDQVVAHAWPFDQGELDKTLQPTLDLYGDPNLPTSEWKALCTWAQQRRLVMHNGKFDCHMMRTGTRHAPGIDLIDQLVYDTSLGNKNLWPLEPTALKRSAVRLCLKGGDEDADEVALKKALKAQGKKLRISNGHKRYDLLPWQTMEPYVTVDAELTLLLYLRQLEELEHGWGSRTEIDHELQVLKVLYRMEQRGIGFDAAGCLAAAAQLRKHRKTLAEGLPFPATVPAARNYYFGPKDHGGLDLIPYSVSPKTGDAQMDDATTRKLMRDGHPYAQQWGEIRKLDTALNMWYEPYPAATGDDGRLRTDYRQTKEEGQGGGGAVSGRFSVGRINLQAIPHASRLDGVPEGVPTPRQFFRPEPGNLLVELDLRQAELRVAAKIARCRKMLDLVVQEQDLHGITARELFQVTESHSDWFKYRQIAKRGNFSFIFGVGPDTFRETLFKEASIEMTLDEAKQVVEAWRSLYPEFGRAIWRYDKMADRDRFVRLVNGRRRWFYPYEYTHKAFNQVVQGSLAEFAKQWAIVTEHRWPGHLILLVHDSQVMEVPDTDYGRNLVEQVAAVGARIGTKWFNVPMGVDHGLWGEH